jgi:hypothetical protein
MRLSPHSKTHRPFLVCFLLLWALPSLGLMEFPWLLQRLTSDSLA